MARCFPWEHCGATEGCRKLTEAGRGPLGLQEEPRVGSPDPSRASGKWWQCSPGPAWASPKPPRRLPPQGAQAFRLGNAKLGVLGGHAVPIPLNKETKGCGDTQSPSACSGPLFMLFQWFVSF